MAGTPRWRPAVPIRAVLAAGLLAGPVQGQDSARVTPRNFVTAGYAATRFSDDTDPWQRRSLELGRRTAAGPVVARVTHASRFGRSGMQLEAEAYPRLSPTSYVYLDAGWSESPVFPHWRSGAELYAVAARGVELSAGYRQLHFTGRSINLATGSAGLYRGNYWVSLRPWVRLDPGSRDLSASLTARRYGRSGDEYVGVSLGAGTTPGDRLTDLELARTNAFTGGVQGSHPVAERFVLTWGASGERERLPSGAARSRLELTLGGRVDY